MVGAQGAAAVGEGLLEQGEGFAESARRSVSDGEVVLCSEGVGVVGAQEVLEVLEGLLVQSDGFVEPARVPVRAGEVVA